jgi:hypothetical protein
VGCLQGWFPWFASAKEKARIKPLKDQYEAQKHLADEKAKEFAIAEREANKQLGLFSAAGLARAREHFWCGLAHATKLSRQRV